MSDNATESKLNLNLITKELLLKNFPFTPRGNQDWLLEQLVPLLNDPNKKYIVIQAPTGAGKSAFAVAASRCFADAYVLTANKFLQDQYERDFGHLMKPLKGRSNYSCNVSIGKNCANAPCRTSPEGKRNCGKDIKCEYHIERDAAAASKQTLMNFAAGIAYLNFTPYFKDRELIVIDEAHMLESNLTNFVEFVLDERELINLGLFEQGKYMPMFDTAGEYLPFINRMIHTAQILLAKGSKANTDELETCARKLELISAELTDNPGNVVLTKHLDAKGFLMKISLQPLSVAKHADRLVFQHGKKVILLSATILNFKGFCRSLGIPESQATYIDMPSTFPKENRPIVCPIIDNFNQGNLKSHIGTICKVINAIASQKHPNVKGIIHVPSYSLATEIYNALPHLHKRLLYPKNAADQQVTIYAHEVDERPTILLSPSMAEGVDLKDDLSRFQIIVKVPYPSLGDRLVNERKNRDPSWYPTQTLLKLVQSYGRSVRSETDHAVTYVLDGNFHRLVDQNRHILPKWFLEAVE